MVVTVDDFDIQMTRREAWDYFSLTNMLKAKLCGVKVGKWFRSKRTLEMLFGWGCEHNPNFNCTEFGAIMLWSTRPGSKNFSLSVKDWIERTNAIGVLAWTGMYGGTFGQRDIALEFAGWVDPFFRARFEEVLRENWYNKFTI